MPKENIIAWSFVDDVDSPMNGIVLIYDYRAKAWSTDVISGFTPGRMGVWEDRLIIASSTAETLLHYRAEGAASEYADKTSTSITSYIETGEIQAGGVAGYGVFRTVSGLFEMDDIASSAMTISLAYDGEIDFTDTHTWAIADGATRARDTGTHEAGDMFVRTYPPLTPRCRSLRIRISDTSSTAGAKLIGLRIDYRVLSRLGWGTTTENAPIGG